MAETFPQYIAAREADIDAARNDPNSEIAFILGYPHGIDTHTAELETLIAHFRTRTAGPKCLTCFSEHIQVLPDEGIVLLLMEDTTLLETAASETPSMESKWNWMSTATKFAEPGGDPSRR